MTAVQVVALVCLPFVWMLLSGAPSRNTMRRIRRNARKAGVSPDEAFDKWMRKNTRGYQTLDRLQGIEPSDQVAFTLVASAAEEISQALMKGEMADQAKRRVIAERWPTWVEQCGSEIATRASAMLDRCGSVEFLVPGELARAATEAARRSDF